MKKKILIILLSFLLQISSHAKGTKKFNFIIDTDMAIDDWGALLYLFNQREKTNLLGITISVSGESHCNPGIKNLLNLIHLAGRSSENIPISCGDPVPLQGFNTFPDEWRKDVDILSGMIIPKSPQPFPKKLHATKLLRSLLKKSKQKVVILTLGPLTNIAQLIKKYPLLKSKIKRIYIMGGAINVEGNLIANGPTENLKNKYAEWNIWIDPLASQKVFRSGIPITLVPLDATNAAKFTPAVLESLKEKANSKPAKFYADLMEKNSGFLKSGNYYFWDQFAASAMFTPVCENTTLNLDVIAKFDENISASDQLEEYSKTFAKMAKLQFKPFLKGRKPLDSLEAGRIISQGPYKIEACINNLNPDLFVQDFVSTLNRN